MLCCALEIYYENALYKFTFDIDIDIVLWGGLAYMPLWHDKIPCVIYTDGCPLYGK